MKNIEKNEFEKFISDYPRKLNKRYMQWCRPPIVVYIDDEIKAEKIEDKIVGYSYVFEDETDDERHYMIADSFKGDRSV